MQKLDFRLPFYDYDSSIGSLRVFKDIIAPVLEEVSNYRYFEPELIISILKDECMSQTSFDIQDLYKRTTNCSNMILTGYIMPMLNSVANINIPSAEEIVNRFSSDETFLNMVRKRIYDRILHLYCSRLIKHLFSPVDTNAHYKIDIIGQFEYKNTSVKELYMSFDSFTSFYGNKFYHSIPKMLAFLIPLINTYSDLEHPLRFILDSMFYIEVVSNTNTYRYYNSNLKLDLNKTLFNMIDNKFDTSFKDILVEYEYYYPDEKISWGNYKFMYTYSI